MKIKVIESEIINDWDWKKNNELGLNPETITLGSHKKAYWKCHDENHSYFSEVSSKAKGHGCPYCSGKRILSGFNDLETICKKKGITYLLEEWDYDKNSFLPSQVAPNSEKKIWWNCPSGHSYLSRVDNRFHGKGCAICAKEKKTSFPEQAIFFYISHFFPDSINNYYSFDISEIDVYIPSLKIGFEYDGSRWHSENRKADKVKDEILKEKGITLYRIKENNYTKELLFENNIIFYSSEKNYKELGKVIKKILEILNLKNVQINLQEDRLKIIENYTKSKKTNSLLNVYPEIALEWNCEKNGILKPEFFEYASNKKVWWKCKNGHEWECKISSRTVSKTNCPFCSGRNAISGENDLSTLAPQLLNEWDYEKNKALAPTKISSGFHGKVWWKCKNGHEWEAAVYSRFLEDVGCPICKNRRILPGYNDFAHLRPDLLQEWDFSKNNINPEEVGAGSAKKIWWKCKKGHEWQNTIVHRVNGQNCPFCLQKKVNQIKDGVVLRTFDSIGEASRITGASRGAISNCCKGSQKTAGGFRWEYAKD